MEISEKRKSELYSAIRETIMDTRVELSGSISSETDFKIAQTTHKIWGRVKMALNIKG